MIEERVDIKGTYLYVRTPPVITFEDMLASLDFLQKSDHLPRELRVLEDARGTKADFQISDLNNLVEKIKETAESFESIRHAVIHDSAKNTAFTMFVERLANTKNVAYKVFSTLKAAETWLRGKICCN